MPDRSALVLSRRARQLEARRTRRSRLGMTGVGFGILLSIVLGALILAGALAYADLTRDLPNVAALPALLNPPDGLLLQPTRVYDRTGQRLLATFAPPDSGPALRRYIPLSTASPQHLPSFLPKATIILSDPGFWTSGGYRLSGLSDPETHPTIAQKLVADLLLFGEKPSLRRALRERILAAQVTSRYGRSQVLEWYLNSADYGNYAYGAEAAAQLYFQKPAADLSPAECAVLAGASYTPGLNPLEAPGLALERGRTAIRLMESFQLITAGEANAALASQPRVAVRRPAAPEPLVVELALQQLDPLFTRARITRGGLAVISTQDFDLQQALEDQMAVPGEPAAADAPPGAGLILDPQSGQVLAASGEPARGRQPSTLPPHDPGTLLAPFVYLTAFTRGFGPASLVWDIPPSADAGLEGAGALAAAGGAGSYHGPVRMRVALANDYAAPAQAIQAQMGADAIQRTEASFGLDDASQASLLDLASAYAVFAAGGARYGLPGPSAVLRLEALDHASWLDLSAPQAQPVVSQPLAYLVNNVLSDEAARWPSLGHPNELEIGRPAAVKLGRSDTDAWAIGYTPSRVVALWQALPSSSVPAPADAPLAPALASLLRSATASLPADGWAAPPGISTVVVCDPSGLLSTRDCPTTVSEVFLSGNEPSQPDTLYRSYTVNRETGLLATVFTPPGLVEDKVFLNVPPEAQAWARSAGIAVAPAAFDAIQAPPLDPDVHISSPAIFSQVSGMVQLSGTASGADFDHYRVLVGKGLNPQAWIVVRGDTATRVEDGLLAAWDTRGLSGLYAVELQVIRADQSIETAITQFTVK